MSKKIKTLEDLRDSKLLFDKNIPAFGYMIIITVATLLIGVIIWSIFTPKTYMIKAAGIVTSENSNYIMPAFGGTITESKMYEGMVIQEGDILFSVKSSEYDLQSNQLEENKEVYEKKIEQNEKLIKSIKDDKNYFDSQSSEDNLYYSTFETYKSQIEQNQFDASAYKNYGYTNEQIEIEMEKHEAKIVELYYSAIKNAENAIQESNLQLASINAQLSALQSGKKDYVVTATTSGVLHLLTDYKEGMVVQAGSAVATVTPENSDTFIEAYVTPADRAKLSENDSVEIVISGLIQSVYGKISGQVVQIDSNATTQESKDGNSTIFKIKIKPDYTYLTSKEGEKIDLLNGMSVEARIQYDKVTYFNYVIEKLGFR
ncbi:MAG: HlyD family efflux transporter periplasmic adaptor subunit [Acutalibacteraceae bacterium]|nr:HlyD family efflux transporter periplasmic adaptor subunit [Acutalibacteraceae bacterium]